MRNIQSSHFIEALIKSEQGRKIVLKLKARAAVLVVLIASFVSVSNTLAQPSGKLPAVFEGLGVDEQLGSTIPLDVVFRDERGREVAIGSYFESGRPVILNLVYHDCPMLCNLLLDGLTKTLREMVWVPGEQFEVVTVSFSPLEGPELASRQKEKYLASLGKPEASKGWHFLTGDEDSIQRLARSVGFEFRWVEEQQQYAHPATLIFLGKEAKITRYLYGLEFEPRNVRAALVEASEGTVGNTIDQLVLFCFQYDPDANSYVVHAINVMKLGGLLTLLVLGIGLVILWRREGSGQPRLTSIT